MSLPLVSIIIPTSRRPSYLPQAVGSALECAGDNGEVLAVPNGPDDSWKQSLEPFRSDPRLRILPIGVENANAARNYGLSMSLGRYVRFLDDDDLLYPAGARHQLQLLDSSGGDVVSAPIELLRQDGRCYAQLRPPLVDDFVAAAMRGDRLLQVTSHLFSRNFAQTAVWDESRRFGQDIDWMLRLCATGEAAWIKSSVTCGGWRRHVRLRASVNAGLHEVKKVTADGILDLCEALEAQGRLTPDRRAAAASGLWEGVHSALFFSPKYWRAIASAADRLSPGSHPDTRFFSYRISKRILTPWQWERLLAPKRSMTYGINRALLALGLKRTW